MIEINSILSQPAYISFSSYSGGDAMILVTAFVVTALFSVIGLLGVVWMCRYFNIYDQPNARKVHHCPVPRLGGVVFMPAAILGVYTTLYLLGDTERRLEVGLSTLAMAAGALIVYIIGIFDDLYGIKAEHIGSETGGGHVKASPKILMRAAFPQIWSFHCHITAMIQNHTVSQQHPVTPL